MWCTAATLWRMGSGRRVRAARCRAFLRDANFHLLLLPAPANWLPTAFYSRPDAPPPPADTPAAALWFGKDAVVAWEPALKPWLLE